MFKFIIQGKHNQFKVVEGHQTQFDTAIYKDEDGMFVLTDLRSGCAICKDKKMIDCKKWFFKNKTKVDKVRNSSKCAEAIKRLNAWKFKNRNLLYDVNR